MTDVLIEYVFDELQSLGSCSSRSEFSVDWLGANEAYYRSVVARDGSVSVRAQAHLAATLRNIGMAFVRSDFAQLRDKGAAMISLHSLVADDLFSRVTLDAFTPGAQSATPSSDKRAPLCDPSYSAPAEPSAQLLHPANCG